MSLLGGVGTGLGGLTTFGISKLFSPKPDKNSVGTRPQPTTMPDPYGNLSKVLPGLGTTNALVGEDLNSMLAGNLSPSTIGHIQDYAARMGLTQTGTTNAPFNLYGGAADIGKLSEQLQQQGLADYGPLVGAVSQTQTLSPNLQSAIEQYNNAIKAAPDPVAAAKFAMKLSQISQLANTLGSSVQEGFGGGGASAGSGLGSLAGIMGGTGGGAGAADFAGEMLI